MKKRICIILKNGTEINVIAEGVTLKKTWFRKRIKGLHFSGDGVGSFLRYVDMAEIATVLEYPAEEGEKPNA
jgi:hypothetical protein